MTTDLPVPDASYSALFEWHEDRTRVSVDTTLQRITRPVVAAYLRKLADEHQYEGGIVGIERLRYDADQLDP